MEITQLARKLEPLMPDQVRHWLRVRDLADPDVKSLVEREMINVAYQVLGDFREKPLLSLPSEAKARGQIRLGTILYETEKWDFGISTAELLRNVGIFGMSGSGKTNLAFLILKQLMGRGVPFLFFDWKRTVRHLIPDLRGKVQVYTPGRSLAPFPFNPFIPPPGLEPLVYVGHVVDVMADAFTLGDGSRRILQKSLSACYEAGQLTPSPTQILSQVDKIPDKSRVTGWKISAIRALESLEFANLTSSSPEAQRGFAESVIRSNTVVELDSLSQGAKKFLVPMMSLWIYYVRLAAKEREQLKLMVFLEEAHHVLYKQEHRAKETVLNMLLRQCREVGIGVVVIDQHTHLLSTAALGNTYTVLCLNQRDPSDINKSAGLCLLDSSDKKWLSMLPVGQAIVKLQDRWRRPFMIKVPHLRIRKGSMTDNLLRRFQCGELSTHALRRAVDREFGRRRPDFESSPGLDSESLRFVQDVLEHPDDGVRQRYKRLRVSGDKGHRLKSLLVEQGVIEEEEVKVGRTRKLLLRTTPAARSRLGLTKTVGRGSLAHEYWKRFWANRLSAEGYAVELEAPRHGSTGRVDALARRRTETVAVEVETGKSNVVENVRRDLRSGFSRVLVVATDAVALKNVESKLAKAGLIVPGRVALVLRDSRLKFSLPRVADVFGADS